MYICSYMVSESSLIYRTYIGPCSVSALVDTCTVSNKQKDNAAKFFKLPPNSVGDDWLKGGDHQMSVLKLQNVMEARETYMRLMLSPVHLSIVN